MAWRKRKAWCALQYQQRNAVLRVPQESPDPRRGSGSNPFMEEIHKTTHKVSRRKGREPCMGADARGARGFQRRKRPSHARLRARGPKEAHPFDGLRLSLTPTSQPQVRSVSSCMVVNPEVRPRFHGRGGRYGLSPVRRWAPGKPAPTVPPIGPEHYHATYRRGSGQGADRQRFRPSSQEIGIPGHQSRCTSRPMRNPTAHTARPNALAILAAASWAIVTSEGRYSVLTLSQADVMITTTARPANTHMPIFMALPDLVKDTRVGGGSDQESTPL